MSRLFSKAFSMEGHDDVAVDEATATEHELEMEKAAAEVAEAGAEVDAADAQGEELAHAERSMEAIAMSLEGALNDNEAGITRETAAAYHLACRGVLGDALPSPVASLESFGGDSERAEASALSLESIKDTIKRIWEAIKRAVGNAIRAVADFFSKLFGGVARMKKRVEDLQKTVADLKKDGATPDKDDVNTPGAQRLQIGGKFDKKVIQDGAKLVADQFTKTLDEITDTATEVYLEVNSRFKAKKDSPDEFNGIAEDGSKEIMKGSAKIGTQELPGGKSFVVKKSDSTGSTSMSMSFSVEDAPRARNYSGNGEVKAFSISEIESLLKSAEDFVKQMENAKKAREAVVKAREEAVKAADEWSKEVEKGRIAQSWTQAQVNMALRLTQLGLTQSISRSDNYAFSYVRGLLQAVDAHVKNLKKPSKDD